jgi:hypothetical protein
MLRRVLPYIENSAKAGDELAQAMLEHIEWICGGLDDEEERLSGDVPYDCKHLNRKTMMSFGGRELEWCPDCGALGQQAFGGAVWHWAVPRFVHSQNLLEQHEKTQRDLVAARQQIARAEEIAKLPAAKMVGLAIEAYNLFLPLMNTIPAAREWVAKFVYLASGVLQKYPDEGEKLP